MNAAREIATKSMRQINRDTARLWANRAIAYFRASKNTYGFKARKLMNNFEDSRHEALEHAALAEDNGHTLRQIEKRLKRIQQGS